MLWKTFIIGDQERAILTRNGRFVGILEPGEHRYISIPGRTLEIEKFLLRDLVFQSNWTKFLVNQRPALATQHFVKIETLDTEVALIYVDGKLHNVLTPGKIQLFWRGVAEVTSEVIDVIGAPDVPAKKLATLERLGRAAPILYSVVDDSKVGLLHIDGRFVRLLGPGKFGFWSVVVSPRVDLLDLRLQTVEVLGQEILTRDKVTLRVNVTADYQVVDAVKAKQYAKDFTEHLYRTVQLSVRQTLGKKTLEEVQADKTSLDDSVAEAVRTEMAQAGIRVGAIALKDIILPGDMRDMLNQVVAAEKQAQANLIRRREETAATRSLLNTAKLMEDNPILVRLKELETLERVVEKVDRVSVSNGFEGLLTQLIHIKPDPAVKA